MKTSNCCDAYVNPDLMICSDCKEHCDFGEEEDILFYDTLQKEKDKLITEIYAITLIFIVFALVYMSIALDLIMKSMTVIAI